MTGLIGVQDGAAAGPLPQAACDRGRAPRLLQELEAELKRLYLRTMDEPVPARLIDVLRTRLTSKP